MEQTDEESKLVQVPAIELFAPYEEPGVMTEEERDISGYEGRGFSFEITRNYDGSSRQVGVPFKTGLEKLTKMEMEGELSAGLKIADPRQMMIADGLAYIELYEGQLFRLEEAGYGTPVANEREEPLDDGIRRVVIPSGVVFTEAEVERHFSEEQYQGDEPQEEVVWEKVRTYLELS